MKSSLLFVSVGLILLSQINGCAQKGKTELDKIYPKVIMISVENPAPVERKDEAVVLNVSKVKAKYKDFNPNAFVVNSDNSELASQFIQSPDGSEYDQIIFVSDFSPREKKTITIRYANSGSITREYPQRTQAELSHKVGGYFKDRKYQGGKFQNVQFLQVPPEHTDHSFFIRYEGPGWESDKVGYRFYLDWRNASDIFGKKVTDMVLQNVGQDGFDSYHEMSEWGMDILKVGESLGIGSIGMWYEGSAIRVSVTDSITCEIIASGPIYSQIRTNYFGWQVADKKYDLSSDLSITAGSRLTKHKLRINNSPDKLCTGIVKHPVIKKITEKKSENKWGYLATFGEQSLAEDTLGMAIIYDKSNLIELQEDTYNYVVILKPGNGNLEYYFLAAWEKEPGGITNEGQFIQYLGKLAIRLDSPINVSM
jgi:hypothetical protein